MHITRILRQQISNESKLVMVAILHRHGDRAPIKEHLYPNSLSKNNDFFPVGDSNLTNLGKMQLYEIGKTLRKQYDSFLGPYYLGSEVQIITSSIERTQMSVLALCAGLFPPQNEQIWNKDFCWQPVVYTEIKKKDDRMIRGPGDNFPEYVKMYKENLKSEFNQALLKCYSKELSLIREYAGYKKPSIQDAYYLLQSLIAEQSMGLKIPDWTKEIFPDKLEEIAVYEYDLSTLTVPLAQYAGGSLAKRITDKFTKKINKNTKQKCLIFSGHESTIGYQLRLLGIKDRLIPTFGSHLIWELHQQDDQYFVKVLYENFTKSQPGPKECFCITFEEFLCKMQPYFPSWEIIV